jgi:hypothetical protein
MRRYDVVKVKDSHPWPLAGAERIEGVLPTPMLISEGTRDPVEAYQSELLAGDMGRRYPGGLWRVREDAYDQRHGVTPDQYVRVIIEVVDDDKEVG